jgi:hypothetical protein
VLAAEPLEDSRRAVVAEDRANNGLLARRGKGAAWVLVAVFCLVFVVLAWTRITAPFGDSHDGRNAAVWASGSRALRTEGPIASRLGARLSLGRGETTVYVDHPPLTYWETAAVEEVVGVHPWSSRAPAWIGMVVAIALAFALLQECGISPLAAATGVALGFGCPMIGLYGTMLDSWVVGLPWAVGSLLVWQRERNGRSTRRWVVAVTAIGTIMSSWLGILVVAAIVIVEIVRATRARNWSPQARTRLVASAAALLALALWIVWAAGSFDALWSTFVSRSGAGRNSIGVGLSWHALRGAWSDLLTGWQTLVGIPVAVIAIGSARTRRVAMVALASVVVWVGLFRNGAAIHDYWSLWIVLTLSFGFAVVADSLGALCQRRRVPGIVAPVAATLVGVGMLGLAQLSVAQIREDEGRAAVTLLGSAHYPEQQTTAWYVGDLVQPVDWISYRTNLPARQLVSAPAIHRLAATAPGAVILAGGDKAIRDDTGRRVCSLQLPGPPFSLWTARSLADLLSQHAC